MLIPMEDPSQVRGAQERAQCMAAMANAGERDNLVCMVNAGGRDEVLMMSLIKQMMWMFVLDNYVDDIMGRCQYALNGCI